MHKCMIPPTRAFYAHRRMPQRIGLLAGPPKRGEKREVHSYEIHCRPLGRPDLPASMVFTLDGTDHQSVWRAATQRCFDGGRMQTRDGGERWLGPRSWTVVRVRPSAPAEPDESADEDDWPRPDPAFASPATREAAMARVYAGRRYENLPIRRSRTVLAFAGGSRPVALRVI